MNDELHSSLLLYYQSSYFTIITNIFLSIITPYPHHLPLPSTPLQSSLPTALEPQDQMSLLAREVCTLYVKYSVSRRQIVKMDPYRAGAARRYQRIHQLIEIC